MKKKHTHTVRFDTTESLNRPEDNVDVIFQKEKKER